MHCVFCLSVHEDPQQLGRLVRTLAVLDATFYIHVDARVDQRPFEQEVADLAHCCRFIRERVMVAWAGFSQVRFQLALLRAAAAEIRPGDRVFLLTGLDYPICSPGELLRRVAGPGEFIRAAPIPRGIRGARDRYRLRHIRDINVRPRRTNRLAIALVREVSRWTAPILDRPLVVDGREWTVHVGSAYMCLSAEAVQHVLATIARFPQVVDYLRHGFSPDELLIQTIVFNSLSGSGQRVEGTFALGELAALHYFDYGRQVKVLDLGDADLLAASGKMFARKFRTGTSSELMDAIDRGLLADRRVPDAAGSEHQGPSTAGW